MSKPGFSGKPESAIKRADEFIEVDKYDDATEVLFDVLRNKRHRDKVNEQSLVINKFCQLCVDHGKTTSAKDGLYQFRVICSQNLNLFHSVVERFLNNSNEKLALMHSSAQTRSAQDKSALLDLVEIVPFMRVSSNSVYGGILQICVLVVNTQTYGVQSRNGTISWTFVISQNILYLYYSDPSICGSVES